MARTPDLEGAMAAVVARSVKSTLGGRLKKLETRMKRLERSLTKISSRRAAGKVRRRRRPGRPRKQKRRSRSRR